MMSPSFTTTSCGIIDQGQGVDCDARAPSIASSQPACVITNFAFINSGLSLAAPPTWSKWPCVIRTYFISARLMPALPRFATSRSTCGSCKVSISTTPSLVRIAQADTQHTPTDWMLSNADQGSTDCCALGSCCQLRQAFGGGFPTLAKALKAARISLEGQPSNG